MGIGARLLSAMISIVLVGSSAQSAPAARFGIDDYFRLRSVPELSISSDGTLIAYISSARSLSANDERRELYYSPISRSASPNTLEYYSGAHDIAWVPHSHAISFLISRDGVDQVVSYDTATARETLWTTGHDQVKKFRFSPDGAGLAYIARPSEAPWLADATDKSRAVVVDPDRISDVDFIDPKWNLELGQSPPASLWLKMPGATAVRIAVPGDVRDAFWSSDGRKLSVIFAAPAAKPSFASSQETSIGIVDILSRKFRTLLSATRLTSSRPGELYSGGQWLPHEDRILVQRWVENDAWLTGTAQEWTIYAVSEQTARAVQPWRTAPTYDGWGSNLQFFPIRDDLILAEDIVAGRSSLFAWTPNGVKRASILGSLGGSASHFAFSTDGNEAVFVHQSLTRPPEIYAVRSAKGSPAQLTNLNGRIASKISMCADEVKWISRDGTEVSGWLLKPDEARFPKPWPTITFVHGGPSVPVVDTFAPMFAQWSFPFEVFAEHGFAVFIPNYRGTATFGVAFRTSSSPDGAPIDDIVTGVDNLIEEGVADRARLGLTGHSHGAWLGPMVLTRTNMFRATSFAEGWSNFVVTYELSPGALNREVHDAQIGVSLYERPDRYNDLSPDMHFSQVSSANLFEGGARSLALDMLGLAKVSRRNELPTEMVVYPDTGHMLTNPQLQREAAERNLDWFRFWLKGEEDTSPAKREQYGRWRAMAKIWDAKRRSLVVGPAASTSNR